MVQMHTDMRLEGTEMSGYRDPKKKKKTRIWTWNVGCETWGTQGKYTQMITIQSDMISKQSIWRQTGFKI